MALQDMTRRFSQGTLAPLVRKMDEEQKMDPELLQGLFEVWHCASRLLYSIVYSFVWTRERERERTALPCSKPLRVPACR